MNLFEIFADSQIAQKNLQKIIDAEKNKKYELIETITVSQDGISVIERTREPDGTPYNFEKIYINFDVPMTSKTATDRVFINEKRTAEE